MNLGLGDKVALVTGSSQGIGHAIAAALAAEGCRVIITGRDPERLNEAKEDIRKTGGRVHAVTGDALNPADIEHVVKETVSHYRTLHILVNNVGGVGRFAPFHKLSDEDWEHVLRLNVMSAVRFTRAALPYMQRQQWGRIINIASESGLQPDPEMPHYNASKGAILVLTKSLSKAYAADNILINSVSPAFIRTPLVMDMMQQEAEKKGLPVKKIIDLFLRQKRPHIELKRPGEEKEVAAVVAFLASEVASFVTGANYRVDGGSVASV
ncbi:MAG: glucose 1-dehydrogenase [Deltaproteobacteria bacterium]